MAFVEPVTLTGRDWVVLEPLGPQHVEGLRAACVGLEHLWVTAVPTPPTVEAYVEEALEQQRAGDSLPFAVLRPDGTVVGSTRYCHVDAANRRLEIGYTWYTPSAQRTGLNTEAKLLLLGHAFEQLDCIAVEFRTHWFNVASRRAIERLGAKQDGVLRNHQLSAGVLRDTVVFSILPSEWPTVRHHLRSQLDRPRP